MAIQWKWENKLGELDIEQEIVNSRYRFTPETR